MPITAADLMNGRVLPFYDALGISVAATLTDNGREFCGKLESHPYELLLAMNGIEHRTTKVRSPRTNGFVERMNRTLLDECFRVEGRKTWYVEPEEIQADLDPRVTASLAALPLARSSTASPSPARPCSADVRRP